MSIDNVSVPQDLSSKAGALRDLDADNPLNGLTIAEAETYIDGVTDLATARAVMKKMARVLLIHEARLDFIEEFIRNRVRR